MSRRKPYRRSMDGWWRRNPYFVRYMLREGTSVFLFIYALILLFGLAALGDGEDAWNGWLASLGNPVAVLFHLVALTAAIYHTITWFAVAPKAMPPVALGGKPVPDALIVRGQYAATVVISLVILVIAL